MMQRFACFALLYGLVGTSSLFAQGSNLGTIRGTVTDATGAVVPGAQVEIVDLETSLSRRLASDGAGNYEAASLKYGNYRVIVTLKGFSTAEITGIVLRTSETVRADANLKTVGVNETVVISAEAPQIETEGPTISGTLDNKALVELPRDSRDIYSFLYLNPNIVQGGSDGGFKFLGAQTYGASFALDGQRSNGGVFGEPTNSQPSLEAVGQLVVLSNDFTAEYAGIANVRVETKRGEASYHGSAFYNNKNSALAAWNLNDKIGQANFIPNAFQSSYPNPYFNLNEVGGSFSGPVPKWKNTFFLLAFERRWSASPVSLNSTRLPHPSLWNGDFSGLDDSKKPKVAAGVQLTADEVANNTVGGLGQQFITIPQRLLNPVTTGLIKDYFPPISTAYAINPSKGTLPEYFNLLPRLATRNLGTARLDHDFSSNDKIYWVYNAASQSGPSNPVVNPFEGLGLTQNDNMNHTFSVSHVHLFSPRLINEARGGFNRQDSFRQSNQTLRQFLTRIGFDSSDIQAYGAVVGNTLDTPGHPAVIFGSGLQNFTNGGRNTYRPLDQSLITFGDTLSWIKGKHAIKMGADLVRNAATDGFSANRGNPRGSLTYSGAGPDAFSRFLMGMPANTANFNTQVRGPMHVFNWEQGYFVQDDFKIHPRFTLNLGLRYELISPFVEADDLLVNFDPTYVDSTSGNKGRFVVPSQDILGRVDPRMIAYGITTADKVGVGRSLVRLDKNNFAPRVGAAWRITDKFVLRGGYGFYYPTSAAQGMRDAMATNPFNQSRTLQNTAAAPLSPWPGFAHGFSPLTGGFIKTLSGQPSANAIPFDLQSPRIEQFNITLERELGWQSAVRLSYLGTRMHNLITGKDLNMIPPSDNGFATSIGDGVTPCDPYNGDCDLSDADLARRPFPGLGTDLSSYGNFGHGRMNAFQLEVKRRFAGGFLFNASYTLLDQQVSAVDSANATLGGTAYNQFNPEQDFGRDTFVPRHRFVFYSIYEVPVGKNRKFGRSMPGWAEAVAGGWQTSWQMFAKSGTGFTPYWTCDNCDPVFPGNIASDFIDALGSFNGTSFRPVVTGNPNVRSGDHFYSADAFDVPPAGADLLNNPTVAKRNLLTGPGTWGLNLGIHKVFSIGEKVRADLGADFNNLLNHPLFSPDADGGANFSYLGSFSVSVDPNTRQLLPITDISRNPDFGRLITSYTQESVDSRRTVRLKLRITF